MGKRRRLKSRSKKDDRAIEPYAQEALLIDAVAEMAGERLICMSAGLAQLTIALTADPSEAFVVEIVELDHERLLCSMIQEARLVYLGTGSGFAIGLERRRPRLHECEARKG